MHKCTPSSSVFCLLKSIIDCYVLQNLVMRDTINANSVVVYIPTKSFHIKMHSYYDYNEAISNEKLENLIFQIGLFLE